MHEYYVKTNHPALVVEMRLGKTLVTVRGTVEKGHNKIIVNAPINAMNSWEKELSLEGERFIRAYACPTKTRIDAISKAFEDDNRVWVLMNYEGYRYVPRAAELDWDCAICDESVKLKNPKSQVSGIFAEGFRRVKSRVILTGLIAPESQLDIFQQFKFLHGRFMNRYSYWQFRSEYFQVDAMGYAWSVKDYATEEKIKKTVHEKAFVLRRADAGMVKEKLYTTRTVVMNPKQLKLYKQIEKEFAYELEGVFADETIWATEKAIWLNYIAGGFTPDRSTCLSTAKYDEILYLLKNDLKDQKAVIWFRYVHELKFCLQYLNQNGIKTVGMYGDMNVTKRNASERDFNGIGAQVLCCMEKLAAEAKDFSVASVAFYYSNEMSGNIRGQSEDRILHPLKDDALLYVDMVTSDTVDEEAIKAVQTKVFNARAFMTNFYLRRNGEKPLFML
jgi:hypothetical protein